jgi:hypothetical protein
MTLLHLLNVPLRPLGLELRHRSKRELVPWYLQGKQKRRFFYLRHLVQVIENVPGEIVECGVGGGLSLGMLGLLTEDGEQRRRIWGFDSFEGLPEPSAQDEAHREPERVKAGRLAHGEAEVRAGLVGAGFSNRDLKRRFVLVKGFFPVSFPQYSGDRIALLHLDVDLYQSYKDCLEWFEPLVVPGGVIAFDEYRSRHWVGATAAVDEYFGGPPPGIQRSSRLNRWFWIKP